MNKNASMNKSSSSFNTTKSGMWENERKVCETTKRSTKNPAPALSPSSPSPSLSAASVSPSTTQVTMPPESEAKNYLPQFIVRRFGDNIPILIESCELKSKFKVKRGIVEHHYSVSWIEDAPIHQEINKMSMTSSKVKKCDKAKKKKAGIDGKVSRVGDCPKKLSNSGTKKDLTAVANKSQTSPNREIEIEIGNNTKENEPNIRKCDGPCGKMREITDLRVLGRCDHAICSFCVINAPMFPSDDGSMGCCNKRCFAGDLINQIPDSKRRHELYSQMFKNQKFEEVFKLYKGDIHRAKTPRKDLNSQYSNTSVTSASSCTSFAKSPAIDTKKSSTSGSLYQSIESLDQKSCSKPGSSTSESETERCTSKSLSKLEQPFAQELLMFYLVILESSYFSKVKRVRFEEELEAKMPLLAAVEELMGVTAGLNLFNPTTRIFYCPNETMNTDTMLEMNAKEHGTLTLGQLATINGKINIVIDYTGKLVQAKRKPFKKSSVNAVQK